MQPFGTEDGHQRGCTDAPAQPGESPKRARWEGIREAMRHIRQLTAEGMALGAACDSMERLAEKMLAELDRERCSAGGPEVAP
jgi:hypothetical protein